MLKKDYAVIDDYLEYVSRYVECGSCTCLSPDASHRCIYRSLPFPILIFTFQDQAYVPPITRFLNKAESVIFHFFSLLPRFRLGFLTLFVIWFITTFQFGRLLSEHSVNYGVCLSSSLRTHESNSDCCLVVSYYVLMLILLLFFFFSGI